MLVSELAAMIEAAIITEGVEDKPVECGYTCDLLSWVMAKGKSGCAWITVQTHLNVVAVASLHDMACIICPEGIAAEDASVKKAAEEGIAVLTTSWTAYAIAGRMQQAGIPSA